MFEANRVINSLVRSEGPVNSLCEDVCLRGWIGYADTIHILQRHHLVLEPLVRPDMARVLFWVGGCELS